MQNKNLLPNKPNGEMNHIMKHRLHLAKTNQETLRLEKQQKKDYNKENDKVIQVNGNNKRFEYHPEK